MFLFPNWLKIENIFYIETGYGEHLVIVVYLLGALLYRLLGAGFGIFKNSFIYKHVIFTVSHTDLCYVR